MDLNPDPYNPYPPRRQPPMTPAQKKAVKEGLAWVIGTAVVVGGMILFGKTKKSGRRR